MSGENKVNLHYKYKSLDEQFKELAKASEKIGVPFTNQDGSYKPFIDVLHGWAKVWEDVNDKISSSNESR